MKCARCGRELLKENFRKTRWGGYAQTCNECMNRKKEESRAKNKQEALKKESDAIAEASVRRLKDFTPRDLMQELARRGYTGKLQYTETRVIDIACF